MVELDLTEFDITSAVSAMQNKYALNSWKEIDHDHLVVTYLSKIEEAQWHLCSLQKKCVVFHFDMRMRTDTDTILQKVSIFTLMAYGKQAGITPVFRMLKRSRLDLNCYSLTF